MDAIIIAALLFLSLAAFAGIQILGGAGGGKDEPARVFVYVDGELRETVVLNSQVQEIEIRTPYGVNTLIAYPDGVKMKSADCASQTCVHTPKRIYSGGVIACLPHKLLIRLEGRFDGGVDAIAS
ncbi:MAG: NusG domain II-containing protein [Clostridiales bacterium]|jgi:hypothetical protein|nr:NusG domain II-containing protein [Clostridiales bacterium]